MKPTKKQRHDIYVKMLKRLQFMMSVSIFDYGFCGALDYVTNYGGIKIFDLPEIMRHEPEKADTYWFAGTESGSYTRQFILMAAIKDTEPNT